MKTITIDKDSGEFNILYKSSNGGGILVIDHDFKTAEEKFDRAKIIFDVIKEIKYTK